jgi:hypothetical protein
VVGKCAYLAVSGTTQVEARPMPNVPAGCPLHGGRRKVMEVVVLNDRRLVVGEIDDPSHRIHQQV